MIIRKKLIEVALPLEAINKASAREKSIRHGHPSTLHLWWARRPLAAARAVIFSQMVDDPSGYLDVLRADPKLRRKAEAVLKARLKLWEEARALAEKAKGSGLAVVEPGSAPTLDGVLADQERQRLFRIIEDLVLWENTTNEELLQKARDEIWNSWRRACLVNVDHPRAKELFDRHKLPAFHDPFAGGGSLPLEAQRLGLEAYASDLNPVAVLINKAMIEIPPKFAGKPPVNPASRKDKTLIEREWRGAQGLAEDVRYYGQWMRDEAEKGLGHLYPSIEVTAEVAKGRPDLRPLLGENLTVIAWLWARTVKSPNPAFATVDVPLASTFMLSTKAGKEAYVEPVIENGGYRFTVKVGKPKETEAATNGTKLARGANFKCLMSGTPINGEYIKAEGRGGRMSERLMAIVAQGGRGQVFLAPTDSHTAIAAKAHPSWIPDIPIAPDPKAMWTLPYGFTEMGHLFTSRQLVALTTFADLVEQARARIAEEMLKSASGKGHEVQVEPQEYADAVALFLGLAVGRSANYWSGMTPWGGGFIVQTFGRQGIPLVWDHAEANPFSDSTGNWTGALEWICRVVAATLPARGIGHSLQEDAQVQDTSLDKLVSTDPPYYHYIGYSDLADFFYVWLRRALGRIFPDLFGTITTPKANELVALPYRQGSKAAADDFFLRGMTNALGRLCGKTHPAFPVSIYYAFKQEETNDLGTVSTGWETFLEALIGAGYGVLGTWPIRTERDQGLKTGTNVLASSIILVCRPRAADSPTATRREFLASLKAELPQALAYLQSGNIAPVDLAQAAIGPGMAVYTRYSKVLDAEGKLLSVGGALALINQTLDEALAEQEGDFDADSRFALGWFEEYGFGEGQFGVADVLARAKVTAVEGLADAGIIKSGRGKVRLLKPEELSAGWDPSTDGRLTAWEIVHHLIRVLASGGEGAAAELVAKLGPKAEIARELAYRLYTLCERKKRSAEALGYNGLVQSWAEIVRLARDGGEPKTEQAALFGETEE